MKISLKFSGLLLLIAFAAGCATAPSPVVGPVEVKGTEVPGPSCVGVVDPAPEGTRAVEDEALLASALGEEGKGQLCMGAVFEVTGPVTVYRVWTASKPWSELGRWWSLQPPEGPVEQYRADNAICPEWSELDQASVCQLVIGSRFVMGPGQSATCKSTSLPQSATNQVYIDNDTRQDRVFVEQCQPFEGWSVVPR